MPYISDTALLEQLPNEVNEAEILPLLYDGNINWRHVAAIKRLTGFQDEVLSDWLNISVKTFREYKKPRSVFKQNVKEQVLMLLALMKHGALIFGSIKQFEVWLNQPNFLLDGRTPASFLNTVSGIRFIDDRLRAMEFGDNV